MQKLFTNIRQKDFTQKVESLFITRTVVICINLLITVIIARYLSPEQYGLLILAITIVNLTNQFGNLGLQSSNTYYISKNRTLLPQLISNSVIISFSFALIMILMLELGSYYLPEYMPLEGQILFLTLFTIPFNLIYTLFQGLLIGLQEIKIYNKIEIAHKILRIISIILLIIFHFATVENIFAVYLMTTIIGVILIIYFFKKFSSFYGKPSMKLLKKHIPYGLKAYIAMIMSTLVLKIDLLIIHYILGPKHVGQYAIGVNLFDILMLIPSVISSILFPKISEMHSDNIKFIATQKATIATALMMLILVGVAGIAAKPFFSICLGPSYYAAIEAFYYLLPGAFFLGVEIVLIQFLASVGFPRIIIYIWILPLILNIVFNLWFIPIYGINAAAIASSLSYCIVFISALIVTYRHPSIASKKII